MKNCKNLLLFSFLVTSVLFTSVSTTKGCSRVDLFKMSELFSADFIVRATAVKYIVAPKSEYTTTGPPESVIEFKIEETIWGTDIPATIALNGYLSSNDDFNENALPYKFIRRNGRSGFCFANTYKEGAQFLLFVRKGYLKIFSSTGYTTNLSALGPNNEQLRSADDPWIKWVKAYISPCVNQEKGGTEFSDMSKANMNAISKKQTTDLNKYQLAKCYLAKYGTGTPEARNYMQIVSNFESTILKP